MSQKNTIKEPKNKTISDIRSYFEKRTRGSPELISYHKRESKSRDSDSSSDDSIVLNLNISDNDTLCCGLPDIRSTPSSPLLQPKMGPTKNIISEITKAVGDVIGVGGGEPAAPGAAALPPPVAPASSSGTAPPVSYLTASVMGTPLSEAASLTGDWNMDDQVLVSDDNPDALENFTSIETDHAYDSDGRRVPYNGKFAVLGYTGFEKPLPPQAQEQESKD